MIGLAELQDAFARALLRAAGERDFAPDYIEVPSAVPSRHVAIHARNYRASLTAALKETFPVTAALTGEGFFIFAAARFLRDTPPGDPRVAHCGSGFPAFLAGFAPAGTVPYLADVARFEWALRLAMLARRGGARVPEELRDEAHYGPGDGAALFASQWPVTAIWRAHREGRVAEGLALHRLPACRALVFRDSDDVRFSELDKEEFAFLGALAAGTPLGHALGRAAGEHADTARLRARLCWCLANGAFRQAADFALEEREP